MGLAKWPRGLSSGVGREGPLAVAPAPERGREI
jgi:hypothetical protein